MYVPSHSARLRAKALAIRDVIPVVDVVADERRTAFDGVAIGRFGLGAAPSGGARVAGRTIRRQPLGFSKNY